MQPLDPACTRAYLRSTELQDWVAWCDRVPHSDLAAAIRDLLVDPDSGSVREAPAVRAALFDLASREAQFHAFLESEASFDAVTAGFLEQQLDAENGIKP
jgi:hypothetical protein